MKKPVSPLVMGKIKAYSAKALRILKLIAKNIETFFRFIFKKGSLSSFALILFLVTVSSAVLLGVINRITSEPIRLAFEESLYKAGKAVFPGADELIFVDDTGAGEDIIMEARTGGRLTGFTVFMSVPGYSGAVSIMVGVDLQGQVTGVEVLKAEETPGYGGLIGSESFLSQFAGASIPLKTEDIDIAAGATVSSRAVVDGVNGAVERVLRYLGDLGGQN